MIQLLVEKVYHWLRTGKSYSYTVFYWAKHFLLIGYAEVTFNENDPENNEINLIKVKKELGELPKTAEDLRVQVCEIKVIEKSDF